MCSTRSKPVRIAAFAAVSAFVFDPQAAPAQSRAAAVGPTIDGAVGRPGLDPYAFYVFARNDPRPPEAPLARQESRVGPTPTEKSARASGF